MPEKNLQCCNNGSGTWIGAIAGSGGSYAEKLKNNRGLIDALTDMVTTDCGATEFRVDGIIEKYRKQ